MSLRSSLLRFAGVALFALTLAALATPARALKFATWNLMTYENPGEGETPSPYIITRQANFRTVMAALSPDVICTEEMNSVAAKDSFLIDVLGNVEPGQWSGQWVSVSSTEGIGIFWKQAKVAVSNVQAIADGGPRTVLLALIKPAGYVKNTAWTRIYAVHFKAGTTAADTVTRNTEATGLRTAINNLSTGVVGTNFLFCGDTNIYNATDGAFVKLTESESNNNGRSFDPVPYMGSWHTNYNYRFWHAQCPCLTCTTTGQSGGGLDDRLDMVLTSASLQDGSGMDYVPGSYTAFGNDGWHYNTDINAYLGGGDYNLAVPLAVANALHDVSDHIPVMITLQLPAKYAVSNALAFGDWITGGTATQTLNVANGAAAPAAVLNYTLAASTGFGAPAGGFTAAAGAAANAHTLTMDTSTPGVKSGTLTLASNDNDTTSKAIALTGRVIAHAVPSLDSLVTLASDSLDFGDRGAGDFADSTTRVFDPGYGTLQAKLALTGATITGDARFSILDFAATTIGAGGKSWTVHFDDSGAPTDSTYYATLTFATADDALPGGTPLAPLTVNLRARVVNGNAGVEGGALALRFDAPHPNPAHAGADLGFDLPRAAHVTLGVYDLGGRRVASLVQGVLGEGHHVLRWNAQNDNGQAVRAGLYFVRFETPGLTRVCRLAILP